MNAPRLADRQRVTLGLPELTGREALMLVEILDRCSAELWRHYGDEMIDVLVDSLPAEPPEDDFETHSADGDARESAP
jgi:hypothetical protein